MRGLEVVGDLGGVGSRGVWGLGSGNMMNKKAFQ